MWCLQCCHSNFLDYRISSLLSSSSLLFFFFYIYAAKPVHSIEISLQVADRCITFCTFTPDAVDPADVCSLFFSSTAHAAENFKPQEKENSKITVAHCELLLLCLQAVAFRGGHSQSSVCILPCSPQTNFSPSINLLFALLPATIKLGIPPPFHSLSFICTSSNHLSLASLPLSSIKTSRALALMYSSRLVYHHHVQIEPQLFNLCCLNHLHPLSPNLSAN